MLTKDHNRISADEGYKVENFIPDPRAKTRRNLRIGLVGLGLVIVGAMLIGIFTNNNGSQRQSEAVPALNQANPAAVAVTTAAMTVAAAATTSAAAAYGGDTADKSGSGAAQNTGGSISGGNLPGSLPSDRMIIRNGAIGIKVSNVEQTLGRVTSIANGKGGLVFSTNTEHRGDYTYATLTLQVPPARFDETMNDIRSAAVTVTNETSSSQDVTEEFVDNDAQIKNLTQSEQQLNTLLTKANTVGDVLAVQREITTVRGQIDRLQGRQKYLATKTSMASITVSIEPIGVVAPEKSNSTQGWDFGRTLQNAWEGSVHGLQGLATVLITIAVYLWVLPLLLLVYWLYMRLFRANQRPGGPGANQQPPAAPTPSAPNPVV